MKKTSQDTSSLLKTLQWLPNKALLNQALGHLAGLTSFCSPYCLLCSSYTGLLVLEHPGLLLRQGLGTGGSLCWRTLLPRTHIACCLCPLHIFTQMSLQLEGSTLTALFKTANSLFLLSCFIFPLPVSSFNMLYYVYHLLTMLTLFTMLIICFVPLRYNHYWG